MTAAAPAAPAARIGPAAPGVVVRRPMNMVARSYAVASVAAGELANRAPVGVLWESAGRLPAAGERFERARYVADVEGALHVYSAAGEKVHVHPADRVLRILTPRRPRTASKETR